MPKPRAPESARRAEADSPKLAGAPASSESSASSPQPLFRPGEDNTVRGEIVVKLSSVGATAVAESIPTGPLRSRAVGLPATFGMPEIDEVLRRYGSKSVTRLHPPASPFQEPTAAHAPLTQTYLVRLDTGADVGEAVKALSDLAAVAQAEPNRWREASAIPNDPSFTAQWGLSRINCPAAWDLTTGAPSVVVAVVDTGVDLDHPELAPLLLPGQDMVDLAGAAPPPGTHFEGDWLGRDDLPQDEVGHGTHVAGTIACTTNNGVGVAGVTWACSLLPVKVLTRVVENNPPNRVRGVGSAVDIAAGIRWAVDHGAKVINMSLGGSSDTFVERDAVAYAVSKGVVVVAAMGNDNSGDPSYPAAYPGVIAVGATGPTDQRAPFSNFGPHISVVAPGVDILSTVWNDDYATMSGTSMATPHVAGVAALVLSANISLTSDQVKTVIRETAQPLRDNPGDPTPNDQYGSGMIDAAAAVASAMQRLLPTNPTIPTITRPTMPTGPTLPTQTLPTQTLTLPTVTRPTLTTLTRPTLTTLTRPTLTLTRPTLTTLTRPTLTLTRPTLTTVTRPTLTRPTLTTLTRPTLTRPTLTTLTRPTLTTLTRPTLTRPTLTTLTRPTLTTLTRPTLTRPTLTTLTRPTLTTLTRPTLTQTTLTRPTITIETRPTQTILTRPTVGTVGTIGTVGTVQPAGVGGTGATGYEGYYDPYAAYQAPSGQTGYESYYDPYAAYQDPYAQSGYESYYDPYAAYQDPYAQSGYEGYDPYAAYQAPSAQTGYEGYYDPYAAYQDPYAQTGYESYYDPYAAYGYEAYNDPYSAYQDPYAQTGYESYYDPYSASYQDPYAQTGYESYYDPYGTSGYDPYGSY